MATTIKTKNSTTAATAPTGLVQGELAVNITDKKLYVGDASGNSIQIAGQGATNGAGGSNTQVQYNSSGALAGSANLTFDGSQLSVYGITVGRGAGAVATNTAVGASALAANTSGAHNNSFGFQSLLLNTTGERNIAVGSWALESNTTGSFNTAIGYTALDKNTTASNNTAVGYRAAYTSTASGITAVGTNAAAANTTGTGITAVGYGALSSNTTGLSNIGIGGYDATNNIFGALANSTTGSYNVAVGVGALTSNTTASNNTAIGYQAGYSNTTGGYSTFIGYQAGYNSNWNSAGTAGANTCVGALSGYNLTTGRYNNFFGSGVNASGYEITTGSKNTILGSYSGNQGGLDIRTSSNYIVLSDGDGNPRGYSDGSGYWYFSSKAALGTTSFSIGGNAIALAINAPTPYSALGGFGVLCGENTTGGIIAVFANASNTKIGSITVANSGSNVAYNTSSDQRLKENIVDSASAMEKVSQIKVRQFNWKQSGDLTEYGFIAQELNEVLPSSVTKGIKEEDVWGVDYGSLTPLLLKAIQELKAEVDSLKQQLGK